MLVSLLLSRKIMILLLLIPYVYFCNKCIDWFKAGKGPNPAQVVLDKEIDAYFDKKPAHETATSSS
jgi:hypothetical protein